MPLDIPNEIIEKFLSLLWFSCLSSAERITLMTTCPLVNKAWKAQFSRIASTHLYVPRLGYLLYLVDIIRNVKSLIYSKSQLQYCPKTITCFLDLKSRQRPLRSFDQKTLEMYHVFACMNNYIGLRLCFPSVKKLCLEAQMFHRFLDVYADPRQVPLLSTRMSIIFDHEEGSCKEEISGGYFSSIFKKIPIPLSLSSCTIRYGVEVEFDPSTPRDVVKIWEDYGPQYCSLIILAMSDGSKSVKTCELERQLWESRMVRQGGVAFSMHCQEHFEESWSEDIWGVNYRLWMAGRGRFMSMFGECHRILRDYSSDPP